MAPRRYTDEEIADALAVLKAHDGNIRQAAAVIGCGRNTLKRWAAGKGWAQGDAVEKLAPVAEERAADLWDRMMRECLAEAFQRKGEATFAQLLTAAGISADKFNLLTGKPTGNNAVIVRIIEGTNNE